MSKYWLPWLVGMPAETTTAICSVIFGGVLERFPNLKLFECDVPPHRYLSRIYSDSLVHSEESLNLLLKVLTEDNILLGSDYPFPLGEHIPGKLVEDSKHLAKTTKDKTLGINALKFFGLELKDFIW
ncbi:2-amino-3-carboxymuconate-6-semialdehyde decarboxylase [Caerostris extrusa]|uniref:2-amino-3-carboxymuconate-6-semialdehyde decarboxylase n=1 Tax=Caerostris extrusa TaxID=172846 RepID=A0AAV4V9I8_CAEEX|nr:2-amino-3-carboxymuconate-6-semialdehyde decarboxylase [Caerostris extrusa]